MASGGSVKSLSVSVGVPFSEEKIEKFYLESFMQGIKSEAQKDKSIIAAGHSYQTEEPSITITMNGQLNYKSMKSLSKKMTYFIYQSLWVLDIFWQPILKIHP